MKPYPDIASLLPHAHPMILLDRVSSCDQTKICCQTDITPQSPFFWKNGVPSWVGIEYMAQSIAAFSGLNKQSLNSKPQIGFLLGIRYYHCSVPLFKKGWILNIRAEAEIIDPGGLAAVKCSISQQDQTEALVESSVSVFQPKELDSFNKEKNE